MYKMEISNVLPLITKKVSGQGLELTRKSRKKNLENNYEKAKEIFRLFIYWTFFFFFSIFK